MKNPTDVISALVLLIICAIGFYSVGQLPPPTGLDLYGPASFPKLILVILTASSFVLLIKGITVGAPKNYWKDPSVIKKVGVFMLVFYAYLYSLSFLAAFSITLEDIYLPSGTIFGFTTAIFLLVALPLLGRRNIKEIVAVTACTTGTLVVVFGQFFQVLLP